VAAAEFRSASLISGPAAATCYSARGGTHSLVDEDPAGAGRGGREVCLVSLTGECTRECAAKGLRLN